MKGTLVVAAREIAERKLLFLGALVAGLLPLGFPLVPVLRRNSSDARSVAVLLLAATITVAFPLVFGATILVGDIAQKRLSFYFSRPLPAASIWAGKLLAALLISIGCALLAAAPVFFVEGEGAFSSATGGLGARGPLVLAFPGVLLLLLLTHVVASMARLRSAWIILDFFLAVFFAVAVALCIRSLLFVGFWDSYEVKNPPGHALWWLPVALIAILLVASCVQVADGRTDARRSHGALSATLWGVLTLLVLPLAGLAWWVNAATPKDLDAAYSPLAAPRGSWVDVSGPLRARGTAGATFLYDTASENFIKRQWGQGGETFSADGSRAVWSEERLGFFERKKDAGVFIADLASAKTTETTLACRAECRVALSPSGRALVILDGSTLAAYDVSDPSHPRQLTASRREKENRSVAFVGEDIIRLYPRGFGTMRKEVAPRELEIEEISLLSKKSLVTGHLEPGSLTHARMRADGRYLVGSGPALLTLHDGSTGALVATLSDDLESPKMRFLSGDRTAVAGVANGKAVLKIFLEGEKSWSAPAKIVDLGPAAGLLLGEEIAPGRVALSLNSFQRNDERSRRAWRLAFVDVATGAVSSGSDGLVPADRFSWWFSPTLPQAEAGSPASFLFLDADSRLVRLDPSTGAQTVLLGRSK